MECHYHPGRESTDNCAICGKSICKECGLEIAGKIYCKECLESIVGVSLDDK
ncbi:MAG: ATPase, partial [Methanobrevibacter thaueri]|nr:ATPase [Methanobrevibacter thaueri]